MESPPRRTWTPDRLLRLGAEFAVIVIGVFLALAADSWREGRADRGREEAYVRALGVDVAASLVAIDEAIELERGYAEAARSTIALLRSDVAPEDDSWRARLSFLLAPVSLPAGTVRALIQTGDIGLIRSEPLRAAILELSAALELSLDYIRDSNSRAGNNVSAVRLERESIAIESGRPDTLSLDRVRRSPVVVAGYATHLGILENRIWTLEALREALEKVGGLVEAQETR